MDTNYKERYPIALVAWIDDSDALSSLWGELSGKIQILAKTEIDNLQCFTQDIHGKSLLLVTADITEIDAKDLAFKEISDFLSPLFPALKPHARAMGDNPFVITETICKLRPQNARPPSHDGHTWQAAVTGLKREKEAEYRLLHDNVWPAVEEAIGASNDCRFDIFVIELMNDDPFLFYLLYHTGDDFEKDQLAQENSPATQRWWKYTDACQAPLPAAEGKPWLTLEKL